MTTFTIDNDNTITAYDAREEDRLTRADFEVAFASREDLAFKSADWPISRFAAVWNCFAGAPPFGHLKPVKKFTDRKTAVARIWLAIQALRWKPAPAPQPAPAAPKKAKAPKAATREEAEATVQNTSKRANIILLLLSETGATLADLVAATGWQKHTVRGFISTLQKKGAVKIESFKNADKARTYRIVK